MMGRLERPKSVLLNAGPSKNRRLAVRRVPSVVFSSNYPTHSDHIVGQAMFTLQGPSLWT